MMEIAGPAPPSLAQISPRPKPGILKVWDAAPVCGGVEMKLRSLAGDQGYPGTVEVYT